MFKVVQKLGTKTISWCGDKYFILKNGKAYKWAFSWDKMEKIDIHNSDKGIIVALKQLEDSSMSKKQKENMKKLVAQLQMGKASKKKVGNHRVISYLYHWVKLHDYFKKDFDKITEKQAERFYLDLENNKIKRMNGKPYKDNSKTEFVRSLKRYLGWLWGLDNRKYKVILSWMKDFKEIPEQRAINKKEAEAIVNEIKNPRDKALFMFLFDAGARIEEALNLRISSIEKKEKKDGKGYYYLVNIKISKTLPRRISIPIASPHITEWLKEHPDKNNSEAVLFPIGYDASRKMIRLVSNKVIGFTITPHILRHSSASLYCKKIDNPYKFCYRYGWKFGSKEANRYIDRELLGDEEQEKLQNVIEDDKVEELEERIKELEKYLKGKATLSSLAMLEK